jgi:hypothetical protein
MRNRLKKSICRKQPVIKPEIRGSATKALVIHKTPRADNTEIVIIRMYLVIGFPF